MILCFEIGGSRIRAGLSVDGGLEPLGEVGTPTDLAGFLAVLQRFVRPGLRGVAVSITGVVDPATGRLRVANLPALEGRLLAAEVGAMLGLPVVVLNDADCFALAEARWGAGRGRRLRGWM